MSSKLAAPSRCMASAIWQNRHPLSSAGFACKTSAAPALRPIPTCQLDSAALQLRLAVWRPPYGKTVIRCLLLASPARHRPLSALRPILTCQLDSAALQLRLAVWRPPYGKTVIRCLLQASPARHRPPVLPHVWIWYYNL